jgi:NAD(P)-dependent dehydrogenase (short-subunit alcohol dehydrogenase family)
MFASGRASIVNIASIVWLEALDPPILAQSSYVAAKAGVIGLTRQMAVEYGQDGVRVNAIAPGWHLGTRLGKRVGNFPTAADVERLTAFIAGHTPLGRSGRPDELAGLLLYLCSDASSYLTGQVIAHDGGWTAW